MSSLKEVKNRILSVEGTKKITVARQMISSARLRQSQGILEKVSRYQKELARVMATLTEPQEPFSHPLTEVRNDGPVALVVMASNSGMCGSFNAKMVKELSTLPTRYPNEPLLFFPIGKKISPPLHRLTLPIQGDYNDLADKFSFDHAAHFVNHLIDLFRAQKIKKVDLLYYHNKSAATQIITYQQILPFTLPEPNPSTVEEQADLYIMEPSRVAILDSILPQVIKSIFYVALADHHTSEHAARTLAMQLASENANDILEELRLSYNKLRQQNITAELLDIIGGSFA